MASLTHKIINGYKYYYARVCKRVNGKPKIVETHYLGTVEKMIQNSQQSQDIPEAREVCIQQLGVTAALYDIAKRLQLVEIVDRYVTKRKQGPTVGQYMLIAAINRAAHPTSKSALAEWFENTVGPRLFAINPKQLTSQAFWNHMDMLKKDDLINIENALLTRLIQEFKIDLNCLLYDGTNFYTYINTKTKGKLAKRGHNKQKRKDLRQVSLGMMTSVDFHIPLLHMVYGGNITDPTQFSSVIDELIKRYKHLTKLCPHITLVFDKGNNSELNFESFPNTGMHFVGSLRLTQCKDLIKIPLSQYQVLDDERLQGVKAYRTKYNVFAEQRTVLITYNENLFAGQLQGIGRNIAKCKAELQSLQIKLKRWETGKTRKGKKPTVEGTQNNVSKILQREYMKDIFKTSISSESGFVKLQYHVDQNAIGRLSRTVLGKTILFTDNHEWSDEEIVSAYRSQYKIEHAFRDMKNPHFLGWNPRLHWTDQKIRVHAFYCVMALTLVSLLKRELASKGLSISTQCLMSNLNDIRESIIVYPQSGGKPPKLSYSISRLTKIQKSLYNLLHLDRFRQN
ncbi:MAG: IS1634 family transposase [Deltaproteobacteria bacterium]|nr:IS1634 family transposase [Deltaproteobacteria bacterium]